MLERSQIFFYWNMLTNDIFLILQNLFSISNKNYIYKNPQTLTDVFLLCIYASEKKTTMGNSDQNKILFFVRNHCLFHIDFKPVLS